MGTRTPLHAEHEALGAALTDFAGWQMPLRYDSELAEHRAVRTAAGLFDLSHMGEIEITGPQAAAALDHALAGKLSAVAVGRAKYSLLCTAEGTVLDDLVVYRRAQDHFLAVVNATNTPDDLAELTLRAKGFDATVTDRSAETALIAVQGPRAAEIVCGLLPQAQLDIVTALKYYAAGPATVAGHDVLLARTGYTGEDGFELYLPAAQAPALWRALLEAGRPAGLIPAGLASRDTLRLEAGMALYGHELSTATDPYSAGLGRLPRLDKPFVGRDALAALAEREPTRKLVGLRGSGRRAARAGYPVLAGTGTVVGRVTSGALSPTLGHPIALGYVDTALSAPGTELAIDVRGRAETYVVVTPPFYRR
ncbi:glycine cleavage system aminomethyltransferase GcvT [Pseudonocardia acidicola]|uniref:Aminomethyltransferase n=1 Tax=Pseudonocardia acidicola TaxID=2724939 RepID=A0ABX1SHC5_9PSEU|nr:glycine cleavage system aminomethyltransferase GcvT [Pseudonocardia acidicola]NMH99957.1 glycine cleavage system aminomethyltransferase GcvT [Pseudonocardia acidicola]